MPAKNCGVPRKSTAPVGLSTIKISKAQAAPSKVPPDEIQYRENGHTRRPLNPLQARVTRRWCGNRHLFQLQPRHEFPRDAGDVLSHPLW